MYAEQDRHWRLMIEFAVMTERNSRERSHFSPACRVPLRTVISDSDNVNENVTPPSTCPSKQQANNLDWDGHMTEQSSKNQQLIAGLPCGRLWVRLQPDQHSGSLNSRGESAAAALWWHLQMVRPLDLLGQGRLTVGPVSQPFNVHNPL